MDITDARLLALRATTWLPDWLATILILALSAFVAAIAYHFLFRILTRMVAGRDLFWRSLVERGERPLRLVMIIIALGCKGPPNTLMFSSFMERA